jgi:3-oxoacyl-[acyl-carrier protein] reductase
MDLGLTGKVALVTAASKGIGRATAQELAAEGARVAIASRSADALEAAAAEIKAATGKTVTPYPADLLDENAVRAVIDGVEKDLGDIDILVNSSAGPPTRPFADMTDDDWMNAINIKFMAQMRPSRVLFPRMKRRGSGRILNVVGSHGRTAHSYAVTAGVVNAALLNLTKALAEEGAPHNVLVNALNPGLVETDRVTYLANVKVEQQGITYDQAVAEMTQDQLLKRLARPREVAAMAAFIVSDLGSFMTGALVDVDGGFSRMI